jgi:hypothetical protein
MTRRLPRPRTKPKRPTQHSPERRRLLRAVAVYVGDKALGGLIGSAAAAAFVATSQRPTPHDTPITPNTGSLHLGGGTITVVGSDTLTLTEGLSIALIRKESRDEV